MATVFAELRAIASLETAKFTAGIQKINTSIGTIASGQMRELAGMIGGAFTVGAIANFGRQVLESAHDIEEMAAQTGLSIRNVQILKNAALTGGVSFDMMGAAIRRINAQLGEGKLGVESALVKWRALGKSFEDVKKMTPTDAVQFLATELENAEPGSARFAEITDIIGVKSVKAAVALREYAAAVKGGGTGELSIMSDDDVALLADAAKNMKIFGHESEIAFSKVYLGAVKGWSKLFEFGAKIDEFLGQGKQYTGAEATMPTLMAARDKLVNHGTGKAKAGGPDLSQMEQRKKDAIAKATSGINAITVAEPKAADSMAAYGRIIGGQANPNQGAMELARRLDDILRKMDDQYKVTSDMGNIVKSGMGE